MNLTKMIKSSKDALDSYKNSDPVMYKKVVCMKDIAYKKSDPNKELWHAEISYEQNSYLMLLALAAAVIVFLAVLCRITKKITCRCKKS